MHLKAPYAAVRTTSGLDQWVKMSPSPKQNISYR